MIRVHVENGGARVVVEAEETGLRELKELVDEVERGDVPDKGILGDNGVRLIVGRSQFEERRRA